MLTLKPQVGVDFSCPACGHCPVTAQGAFWHGVHLLADCTCNKCQLDFWHTFPVKHTRYFPFAFAKKERRFFVPPDTGRWLYEPLLNAYYNNQSAPATIRKTVRKSYRKVVIINCLDFLYGHSLLQMLNAQAHLADAPHLGLVMLIPTSLAWLVPDGVAEIWEIDTPLPAFRMGIEGLDSFMKGELSRFEEVYVSETNIQPDWNSIDIKQFTRVPPFDLADFDKKPQQVTFLWREDRYWLSSFEESVWRAAFQSKMLKTVRPYLLWRQKRRFVRTARLIANQLPNMRFVVTGIGKSWTFPAFFQDFRLERLDTEAERTWCQIYASSHVVIGIHGSNLLLPSALAAGFVELLPRYRLANFGEATAIRHTGRTQAFLGRSVDAFAKPDLIAAHVVQMLNGFALFRRILEER